MRRNHALPFGSIFTTTTGPSGVLEYNTQGTNNFQVCVENKIIKL